MWATWRSSGPEWFGASCENLSYPLVLQYLWESSSGTLVLSGAVLNRHERRAWAAKSKLVKLPVVNRHCGECTACCTLLGVPELGKGRYAPCEYEVGAVVDKDGVVVGTTPLPGAKKGCGIYDTRPVSCRTFKCVWLQGLLPIEERPDKTGIIWSVTAPKPGKPQYPVAMEITEGSSKVEPGLGLILKVTERTPVIIVNPSNQRRIVGYAGDPNDLFA